MSFARFTITANNTTIIHLSEGNCHKSLLQQQGMNNLLFQINFYSQQDLPQTCRAYKNLLSDQMLHVCISLSVSLAFDFAVDAMTHQRYVIFLDKFSSSRMGYQGKTKLQLSYTSLTLFFFLSSPTFWQTHDQPEPESFFPHSLWGLGDERPLE